MRVVGGTSQLLSQDQSCEKASTASEESIDSLKEFGIKPGQFSVVIARKSVNRMRAPELFEMKKHVVNNRIIVKINYLAEKMGLRILIARYSVHS